MGYSWAAAERGSGGSLNRSLSARKQKQKSDVNWLGFDIGTIYRMV